MSSNYPKSSGKIEKLIYQNPTQKTIKKNEQFPLIISQCKKQKILNMMEAQNSFRFKQHLEMEKQIQNINQDLRLLGGGSSCCKNSQIDIDEGQLIQQENKDPPTEIYEFKCEDHELSLSRSYSLCQQVLIQPIDFIKLGKNQKFNTCCSINDPQTSALFKNLNQQNTFIFERKQNKFYINKKDISNKKLLFLRYVNDTCLKLDLRVLQYNLFSQNLSNIQEFFDQYEINAQPFSMFNMGNNMMEDLIKGFDLFFERTAQFNQKYVLDETNNRELKSLFFITMKQYKEIQLKLQMDSEDFQVSLLSPENLDTLKVIAYVKKLKVKNQLGCICNSTFKNIDIISKRLKFLDRWVESHNFKLEVDTLVYNFRQADCNCSNQNQKNYVVSFNTKNIVILNKIKIKQPVNNLSIPILFKYSKQIKRLDLKMNIITEGKMFINLNQMKQIGQLSYSLMYNQYEYIDLIKLIHTQQNIEEVLLCFDNYQFSANFWQYFFQIQDNLLVRCYYEKQQLQPQQVDDEDNLQYNITQLIQKKYIHFLLIYTANKLFQPFFMFTNRIIYDLFEDF